MPGAQMPEGEYWTGEDDLFEFMFYCLIFLAVGVQRTASASNNYATTVCLGQFK